MDHRILAINCVKHGWCHGRRANRHDATAQALGQRDDVWADSAVLAAEHLACAAESSLHFVHDKQRADFSAALLNRPQILGFSDMNAAFTLDGFDDESGG